MPAVKLPIVSANDYTTGHRLRTTSVVERDPGGHRIGPFKYANWNKLPTSNPCVALVCSSLLAS